MDSQHELSSQAAELLRCIEHYRHTAPFRESFPCRTSASKWMRRHPPPGRWSIDDAARELLLSGIITGRERSALGSGTARIKEVRRAVWDKTGGECWYCGIQTKMGTFPHKGTFSVDHIIPVGLGGSEDMNNLVPSCLHCNFIKNDRPMDYVIKRISAALGVGPDQITEFAVVMLGIDPATTEREP